MNKTRMIQPENLCQTSITTNEQETRSFMPRGIGRDLLPGCFVCGGSRRILHNIAGFVPSREEGQDIVGMFKYGVYLDYRPSEPNWIQVKIGACDSHMLNLVTLYHLTCDGRIGRPRIGIAFAMSPEKLNRQSVSVRSYFIWKARKDGRDNRNWLDSIDALTQELGRFPTHDEISEHASRLCSEREHEQARDDWHEAERQEIYSGH